MNNVDELLVNSEIRNKLISRVDVLDKVKELLLLPHIDFATVEQVAEYYEVSERWIRELVNTNREELKLDGYKTYRKNEIINFLTGRSVHVRNVVGKAIITFDDGTELEVPNRGMILFPRRAILRIGMLLKDSEVAKEVRTQLLNIEEKASQEVKVSELDQEKLLVLDVIYGEDVTNRAVAMANLLDYKNKYIVEMEQQLNITENKNQALVDGILKWGRREAVNRMVRKIAYKVFKSKGRFAFPTAWEKVWAHLLYKYNISIKIRLSGKPKETTTFDVLNEEELGLLVKTCVSLCEMYNINIDDVMIESA